jgi:hypothetical protein
MHARNLHPRTERRSFSADHYQAAAREDRRRSDRQRLEELWGALTAPAPATPVKRCTRCAPLPEGMRCSACVLSGLLPGLRR